MSSYVLKAQLSVFFHFIKLILNVLTQLEFSPMNLCCYGKALCTIQTGATYYTCKPKQLQPGSEQRYDFCEKCFKEVQGDQVPLNEETGGVKR